MIKIKHPRKIVVVYENKKEKEFYFDNITKVEEQGGYFLVHHTAGIHLFDKRIVKNIIF